MSALSKKIRTLRENKGLTQEKLAQKAGVTKDYVSRMERGDQEDFRYSTLKGFASALGVHPSLLLFGKVLTPELLIKKKPGEHLLALSGEEKEIIEILRKIKSKKGKSLIKELAGAIQSKEGTFIFFSQSKKT